MVQYAKFVEGGGVRGARTVESKPYNFLTQAHEYGLLGASCYKNESKPSTSV